MPETEVQTYIENITALARQLNSFASGLKVVRNQQTKQPKTLREMAVEYQIDFPENFSDCLFSDEDLKQLEA